MLIIAKYKINVFNNNNNNLSFGSYKIIFFENNYFFKVTFYSLFPKLQLSIGINIILIGLPIHGKV